MLHPSCRLDNGLFYFRCQVHVQFTTPLPAELTAEGELLEPAQGYHQGFGVTARDVREAIELLQTHLRSEPLLTAGNGGVREIEISVQYPPRIDRKLLNGPLERRGIRFATGQVFYSGDSDADMLPKTAPPM
jgi:hypothetical protein